MLPTQETPQNLLSGNQLFQRVIISTPLEQKHYTNITFAKTQQTLKTQLQKLIESSFYTHFDIYFAAQNLSNKSFIHEKYKREQQVLKLQIQQTKKKIFQLSRANDELQFDSVMKDYLKNMQLINDRKQEVDHLDFVPVIYVQGVKKFPFYGHLMQEINRKGAGIFRVKVGYRSPFFKLDSMELNLETPLNNIKRKYFNLDLRWKNPHEKYGNSFLRFSHQNQASFKDIDEKSLTFSIGSDKPQSNVSYEWENKFRSPSLHQKYDEFIKSGYFAPSFKSSFKLSKVLKDSIKFDDINVGTYIDARAEVTVPFLSQAQFGKFEFNYRNFYDVYGLKTYFSSDLMKKLLYGSSFETNFRFNALKCFNKKYVSDVNENMEVRGFESLKNPSQTFSNMKLSAKWNIHNFPLLSNARLVPFLYSQMGLSFLDMTSQKSMTPIKPVHVYATGSVGMGLAYYFNKFTQIEVTYKLFGYQNMNRQEPMGFQVRIGVFD